jgi:hypothetical protein
MPMTRLVRRTPRPRLYQFAPMLGPQEEWPEGSPEWAERASARLQTAAESVSDSTAHHLRNQIRLILTHRAWEYWPENAPFQTPDDYCLRITGHRWEALINVVEEFLHDAEMARSMRALLAQAQADHRRQGTRTDLLRRQTTKLNDRGAAYLLRRLARDHADIFAAYERGEFASVRAGPRRLESSESRRRSTASSVGCRS